MRALLVTGTAVLAALVPAAPASTGADPAPDQRRVAPADGAPGPVPRPAPPPLPGPGEGCTLPAGLSLPGCPPGRVPLPDSCVLPVGLPDGTVVRPECPRPDPSPEGRVLPVLPATP